MIPADDVLTPEDEAAISAKIAANSDEFVVKQALEHLLVTVRLAHGEEVAEARRHKKRQVELLLRVGMRRETVMTPARAYALASIPKPANAGSVLYNPHREGLWRKIRRRLLGR
jgi:hypothetical protein